MSVEAMTWALAQRAGSVGHKAVLLALADRAGFDWSCFPSQATIARETEQCERTVRQKLADLEERGLIAREHRYRNGHRTSDRIQLYPQAYRQDCPLGEGSYRQTGTVIAATRCRAEPSYEPSVITTTDGFKSEPPEPVDISLTATRARRTLEEALSEARAERLHADRSGV